MSIDLEKLKIDAEDSSTLRMCEAIELILKILKRRNF